MITQTLPQTIATSAQNPWGNGSWKQELREAVTSVAKLLELLHLDKHPQAALALANSTFPVRVPMPFIRRMEVGNFDDPLLRQVLPVMAENHSSAGFVADPLREADYNPVPGIVHKYHGRVLLITTPVCAVNCRYCFRRHFPYGENNPGKRQWLQSLDYIRRDSSIREVILSGGDPLAADDQHLAWLVAEIRAIDHIKRLRVHSRLPVVIPSRIDEHCLHWLKTPGLATSMVLHINHGNEIDDQVAAAVNRLRAAGIAVLNQSVLLRGVNDDAQTLIALSEKLFAHGVLPYYLHTLDPVAGAEHFHTSAADARHLYREMQRQLPGYLLPKMVTDIPGEGAKVLLTPQNNP